MTEGRQKRASKGPPKRVLFSKTKAAAIPAPPSGRVYVYDERTRGLALCITAAGSRTWYTYRWQHGRPVRFRLGKFPDLTVENARRLAEAVTGDIARGKDVQEERRRAREVPTLAALFAHWRDTYARVHRKTWKDDERQFEKYLKDLHNRRLNTIRPADVAKWHLKIGEEHGRVQANRTLGLLTTVFNKAGELGYDGPNPCTKVRRFAEEERDRFLQGDELGRFFTAVNAEPELYRDFFLVALLTGARRGNVQAMAWEDVNLDAAIWRIPATKAGVAVVTPLCAAALEILARRHAARDDSPWVFPASGRTGHLVDPRKSWERIKAAAELEDIKIHDLRRSLASWQAMTGSTLLVIAKSLGHQDTSATGIYARLQVDPVRESVEKAAEKMLTYQNQEDKGDGQTQTT